MRVLLHQARVMRLLDRLLDRYLRRGHRAAVHAVMLAALLAGVFANSLTNSFHLDDYYRVVNNPGIQQVSRPWVHFLDPRTMTTLDRISGYRPMLPLTLSINYAISGEHVVSYHVANLVFQWVATWFVYLLMLELLALARVPNITDERARWVALVVAAVFAVHPVSGIPVNYICARDLLLMQLFWGASLWGYLRMRRLGFTAGRWSFVLLMLLLSLASKGEAVVAPALVFCLEVTVGGQSWRTLRPWLRSLPMVGVVAFFFLFPKVALGYSELGNVVSSTGSYWRYPLTQARLHLFRYAFQFFWPFSIRQDPDEPIAQGLDVWVVLGLVFIVVTLAVAWWQRRRAPIFTFCILAYWVMYLTTSAVIPFHHLAVDYRPYPSSPYFHLVLALLVLRIPSVRVRQALVVASVTWAAGTSVQLNFSWRNDWTLWRYSVDRGGGPLAHLNLAMATPDLQQRRELLEAALRMVPDYMLVMVNLGRTLVAQGHVEEGLARILQAVQLAPGNAQNRYWYAVTLSELGRKQEAARESARAADDDARNELYQYRAALEAQAADEYPSSLRYLARLKALAPQYPDAGFLEGFALQRAERWDESVAVYREFLGRQPNHVQARFNLAHALMTQGKCAEAIPEFRRVLELDASKMAAHAHLGTCLEAVGNVEEAQRHKRAWEEFSQQGAPATP